MNSFLNPAHFFGPKIYTDSELSMLLNDGIPKDKQTEFFARTADSYLRAIGIHLNGSDDRPLCTLVHVTALVQYSDFKQVLRLLQADAAARPNIESLITALEQGAEKQAAAVIAGLQMSFAHLKPDRASSQRIQAYVQQGSGEQLLPV